MSAWYWKHGFSLAKAVAALLSSFGALWLLAGIASFFSEEAKAQIQQMWLPFLLLGVSIAFWINRPLHVVSCKLSGRDVRITIGVGDIFKNQGALVVGTNCTFDTDTSGIIDPNSIQGQFTKIYYDSPAHMDRDLENELDRLESTPISTPKAGKQRSYPIGTVARLRTRDRSAYLVAIARLNSRNVAEGSFDDLKTALPALWEYIATAGSIEPLVMPVLGTGFSRLTQTREEIVRELISSFVAACAEKRFTESLTIVIRGKDFYEHQVDLLELGRYLRHVCNYTQLGNSFAKGSGTAVS